MMLLESTVGLSFGALTTLIRRWLPDAPACSSGPWPALATASTRSPLERQLIATWSGRSRDDPDIGARSRRRPRHRSGTVCRRWAGGNSERGR